MRPDLVGRLGGLRGERLDLLGNDGEAAAGLAGAGGFDGGVEREQVGLLGNGGDQLDHVADAACRGRQRRDARVGLLCLTDRFGGMPVAAETRAPESVPMQPGYVGLSRSRRRGVWQ